MQKLTEKINEINKFAQQRIYDEKAIGMSDFRRIDDDRLNQIAEVCRENPSEEVAGLILGCMPMEYFSENKQKEVKETYLVSRKELNLLQEQNEQHENRKRDLNEQLSSLKRRHFELVYRATGEFMEHTRCNADSCDKVEIDIALLEEIWGALFYYKNHAALEDVPF